MIVFFSIFSLTMLLRESYGEDIGESDTERSENSEDSEYGGSFINDDDPPNVPSSPYLSAKCMSDLTPLNALHFLLFFESSFICPHCSC